MMSSQLITLAPMQNNFYAMNSNLVNGFNPQQLHPCQLQTIQPLPYMLPQAVPLQQFSLNSIPYSTTPAPVQYQQCPSPVYQSPSPVHFQTQQPVQYQAPAPTPAMHFNPPSPVLQFNTQPQFIPMMTSPSPSPPRFEMGVQKMQLETQVVPENIATTSVSLGGAGSQSSDGSSMLREFYSFNIVKQKASIGEMMSLYEEGLVKAMKNTLQIPSVQFSIHLIPSKKNKNITVQWILNQEKFDYSILKQRSMRRDFQKKLICELAKIDNGSFNSYLSGAKQLTIINEGWSCLLTLKDTLISRNGALNRLLAVPEVDRFGEEAIKNLYKVSEDVKGQALRGTTVVGVRFKLQSDILKMPKFVEEVKNTVGIDRATMIASLKTQKQYKGWSVYLDVGTTENVKLVEEIAESFCFEKTKAFVAEDTF